MRYVPRVLGRLFFLPAVAVAAGGFVAAAGLLDFSASTPPSRVEESLARFTLDRSIARHAPRRSNPFGASKEDAAAGLVLYRAHCVSCHGAPGVDPSEAGASLNPPAPGLTLPRVQARPDGQLYWIVSHGIRMTGMPSFSASRSEREIWELVSAVRRLPRLSEEDRRAMKGGTPSPGFRRAGGEV